MQAWQVVERGHAFWHPRSFSGQAHAQVKKSEQSLVAHPNCPEHAFCSQPPHRGFRSAPGAPAGHDGPWNGKTPPPAPL
jgi:hypothetical protein